MGARISSRVWAVGGAVLGLLLVLATYLLVIGPARSEAATVRSQVDDATVAQAVLRQRLRALETAAADVPALQAARDAATAALPATPDTPGIVRRVQAAAAAHGATVATVSIGAGTTTEVAGVWALPVTVAVTGATADLVAVLADLTAATGRALAVQGAASTTGADTTTLTLDLRAWCTTDPGLAPVAPGTDPATGAAAAGAPPAGGTAGATDAPAAGAGAVAS